MQTLDEAGDGVGFKKYIILQVTVVPTNVCLKSPPLFRYCEKIRFLHPFSRHIITFLEVGIVFFLDYLDKKKILLQTSSNL